TWRVSQPLRVNRRQTFVEAEPARDRAKRLLREGSPDRFSPASWQCLQLVVLPRWRQRNGRFLHKPPRACERRGVLYHLRGIPPAALARPPLLDFPVVLGKTWPRIHAAGARVFTSANCSS